MSNNLPLICTASAYVYRKLRFKQMQYRFAVNFGALSIWIIQKYQKLTPPLVVAVSWQQVTNRGDVTNLKPRRDVTNLKPRGDVTNLEPRSPQLLPSTPAHRYRTPKRKEFKSLPGRRYFFMPERVKRIKHKIKFFVISTKAVRNIVSGRDF